MYLQCLHAYKEIAQHWVIVSGVGNVAPSSPSTLTIHCNCHSLILSSLDV